MIALAALLLLLANKETAGSVTADQFSSAFDGLFQQVAVLYDLDWKMLKAIAMNESGIATGISGGIEKSVLAGLSNPNDVEGSKSSDGKSWGLMQVTLSTGRQFDSGCSPVLLNDPTYSVTIAAQLIQWLDQRFLESDPRRTEWIVKSYNQGIGNTQNEMNGSPGYANAYWERFQRNYARI